ncbi:MAG: zinc-ribbon domain-containing protein, partial [Dehalococcoidia bacterium]|nr:zinc-ribbon domain-containing protein [Dehalococcoidia bacterium]
MQQITRCPNCGWHNATGQQFCLQCGARLVPGCPRCGGTIPTRSKYCPNCGFLGGAAGYGGVPQAAPAMQQQVTYLAPGSQAVVSQQVPRAPQTSAQLNCPQCGAAVDPMSGQCPRCGLLIGKKLLQKTQEQAAPVAPAATPTPFATPISPPPAPPSPPPPRPQSATGQQFPGGYITGPQYNYPPHSA